MKKCSDSNNGNFMMCLELIAELDRFLKSHIDKYGNLSQGRSSIVPMFNSVWRINWIGGWKCSWHIFNKPKKIKIFSRYFIIHFKVCNWTSRRMAAQSVLDFLNMGSLDIQNCCGHLTTPQICWDLQARLKEVKPLIFMYLVQPNFWTSGQITCSRMSLI